MNSSSHKQKTFIIFTKSHSAAFHCSCLIYEHVCQGSALEDIYARRKPSVGTVLYLSSSPGFFIDASCSQPPPDPTEKLISLHDFWLLFTFHLLPVPAALAAVTHSSSRDELWKILHCTWRWIHWDRVMNEYIEMDRKKAWIPVCLNLNSIWKRN